MMGFAGFIRFRSRVVAYGSPTNSAISSGSGRRTFSTVWVVRKPSWTDRNGVSPSSAARRRISARSPASWAFFAKAIPHPASATAITSSWPQWTFSAWDVRARAPTWKTTGRRLPAIV